MATQQNPESLWDDEWIKNLMQSVKDTSSSITSSPFLKPRVRVAKARVANSEYTYGYDSGRVWKEIVKIKEEEKKNKPYIFDPKELVLDEKIQK